MSKRIISILLAFVTVVGAFAADPMATKYSYSECEGSLTPYPVIVKSVSYPDSLKPVLINHVGRHGARYPASAANCQTLSAALATALQAGTITPLGKRLLKLTDEVIRLSDGRWGALDSLGEYEQRMIASRMYKNFRPLFDKCRVNAISSYSPRAMMSMYCFTHQLDRLNNHIDFSTSTGRINSALLRPFDLDADFKDFLESDELKDTYEAYFKANCPLSAIARVLGDNFEYENVEQKRNLAITEYYVLAGLSAMSVECDLSEYFTVEEMNMLWSCFNLRQYLQRSASVLSTTPADIASALLMNLINTTDAYIGGDMSVNVYLRFGHAETLLPLLSLMHLKGCYYMTNYYDTVAKNWIDFDIVPMAANLQMILFYNENSKKYYLRTDLNEKPVALLPNDDRVYLPWDDAKRYLQHCIPIYAQ